MFIISLGNNLPQLVMGNIHNSAHWSLNTMAYIYPMIVWLPFLNSLRPRQNGRSFPKDIFKRTFMNENIWISVKISLKFVLKGPINNILSLVQIMAWRRPGDKALSEPMMVWLLTHICVTRPQWVKSKHLYFEGNFVLVCPMGPTDHKSSYNVFIKS